jgi:hypothetical protein
MPKQNINPSPAKKNIPEWFSKASRFWFPELKNSLSFKACPALIDVFLTGYFLKTPCDIKFDNGNLIIDEYYKDFCDYRPDMLGFPKPFGFERSFHWYPNWMPGLEEGYSAIYLHPINRFDLPFFTISGIIDNDKMNTPGLMPFFLKNNFSGIVPQGTPFVQIIPFKREDWVSEEVMYSINDIIERHQEQSNKFRVPEGGAYKKTVWAKKKYD